MATLSSDEVASRFQSSDTNINGWWSAA